MSHVGAMQQTPFVKRMKRAAWLGVPVGLLVFLPVLAVFARETSHLDWPFAAATVLATLAVGYVASRGDIRRFARTLTRTRRKAKEDDISASSS